VILVTLVIYKKRASLSNAYQSQVARILFANKERVFVLRGIPGKIFTKELFPKA
jgi:hypothetical protein